MAEGEGFEPSIRLPAYTLSKRAPSATRPPLRRSFSDGRETSGADRRRQGGLIIPLQIGHSCATLRLVNHFRRRYGDASVIYHRLDSVNRRLRGGRCGDHCARAPRGHRMDAVGARVVAGAVAGLVSSGRSPAQRHTSLVVGSRHALAFDAAGVVFDGGARRDPCVDLPAERRKRAQQGREQLLLRWLLKQQARCDPNPSKKKHHFRFANHQQILTTY